MRQNHTAAAAVAADVTSGNVEVMAAAGVPGFTKRGQYHSTATYVQGDGVTVAGDTTVWVLSVPTSTGNAPPGTGQSNTYWSRATTPALIPTTAITDPVYGGLAAVLSNIESTLQGLQQAGQALAGRVTALENKVNGTSGTTSN